MGRFLLLVAYYSGLVFKPPAANGLRRIAGSLHTKR